MERHLQHLDILPPDVTTTQIRVIGAGGIGSFTVLALAKMGFSNITVSDFDTIEPHNVDNQLYGETHKGMKKVKALSSIIKVLANIGINAYDEKVETLIVPKNGITIMAVDSMDVRIALYKSMKSFTGYLIDGRMGAQEWVLYTINIASLEERKWYESFLYTSEESIQLPCTAKSIMYTPFSIGGEIAFRVKQILTNEPYERMKTHVFRKYEPESVISL